MEGEICYQLWETGTANLIESFVSEREVVQFLRSVLESHQPGFVESWTLLRVGGPDEGVMAEGPQLVKLSTGSLTV
ncbi:MAG: hypothetical protein WEB00_12230 [Dehalococcoidia bacterium]